MQRDAGRCKVRGEEDMEEERGEGRGGALSLARHRRSVSPTVPAAGAHSKKAIRLKSIE